MADAPAMGGKGRAATAGGGAPPLCLILQPVHAIAARILTSAGIGVIHGMSPGAESGRVVALISRNAPVGKALIDSLPALRVIAKHGVGLDAIDLDYATKREIPVVYTPGVNALSVAEHAMMLILGLAKRLVQTDEALRRGDFSIKFRLDIVELSVCTLGIVGFGQAGRHLSRIARRGFGMRVLAYSPSVPESIFAEHEVARRTDLRQLLGECEFVSLHVPARPGAMGMIAAPEFAVMRPGAMLVNAGRGGVVDEVAAAAALASGRLGGLGLDVLENEPPDPAHPLFQHPNLLVTPHVAGSSTAALERMARGAAEQIVTIIHDKNGPLNLANAVPRRVYAS